MHQYFFIDFDSNTNFDNIYFINKYKHSVGVDGFSTEIEFIFNEVLKTDDATQGNSDNEANADVNGLETIALDESIEGSGDADVGIPGDLDDAPFDSSAVETKILPGSRIPDSG